MSKITPLHTVADALAANGLDPVAVHLTGASAPLAVVVVPFPLDEETGFDAPLYDVLAVYGADHIVESLPHPVAADRLDACVHAALTDDWSHPLASF
jgi:hypothetical protein